MSDKDDKSVDVVVMAQKTRHLHLLEKVRNQKLLTIREIGELRHYERMKKEGKW